MAPKLRTRDEWSKYLEEEERLEYLEELAARKERAQRACRNLKTDGVISGNQSQSTAASGAATSDTDANTGFSEQLQILSLDHDWPAPLRGKFKIRMSAFPGGLESQSIDFA